MEPTQPLPLDTPPVSAMVESIVGCKWSLRLLQLCSDGLERPSEFLRALDGLSTKVLNERLRKLLSFGILCRTVLGEKPPLEVRYRLTLLGVRFVSLLDEIRRLQADLDRGTLE